MQKPSACSVVVKKLDLVDLHVVSTDWGKNITEENVLDYAKHLRAGGKYSMVIQATPLGLLKELIEDTELTIPSSLEDYVYKCVVKECAGVCGQWGGVILPFLNTALGYVLFNRLTPSMSASSVLGTRVAVVSVSPYAPSCEFSTDSKEKLLSTIDECCAYIKGNLPVRGGDCGRWGTRLVPEGFSYVLSTVTGPGWRACELPGRGSKCVMVALPSIPLVQFFKMGNGRSIGGKFSLLTPPSKRLSDVSAFECVFDTMADTAVVYDCSMANGQDIRQKCLSLRIKEAEGLLAGCYISSPSSDDAIMPIKVANYTPPITVIDKAAAERVLFVKDAAPLGLHSGGDAYAWKSPSLRDGMFVLTCRVGECMAVAAHGNCLLRKVGKLINPKDTEHMGTYVCKLVSTPSASEAVWEALRLAKSSERLFTVDECFADEYPHTQITRGGMIKLLTQISPGGARVPVYAPKKPAESKPAAPQKPKVVADKDGWTPAPIGTPSLRTSAPAAAQAKKTPQPPAPGEKSAFWALQDGGDGDDSWSAATTRKKK